jgi:hypothetical protein
VPNVIRNVRRHEQLDVAKFLRLQIPPIEANKLVRLVFNHLAVRQILKSHRLREEHHKKMLSIWNARVGLICYQVLGNVTRAPTDRVDLMDLISGHFQVVTTQCAFRKTKYDKNC